MKSDNQDNHSSSEERIPAESGCCNGIGNRAISRRELIGATAAGIGAVAATATLGSCAPSEQTASRDSLESAQKGLEEKEGCKRVVPASSMAQSLIAAIAPETLVSLVDSFAVGESPQAIDTSGLPCTGSFSEDGIGAFGQMISAYSPDLILDVGRYDQSRADALLSLQEATGIPHTLVNLKEVGLSEAASLLAQVMDVDMPEDKIKVLEQIESVEEKAASIAESDRFVVYLGGGEDGFVAYGDGTVEQRIVKNSGAVPYVAEGAESGSNCVDSSIFSGDHLPDIAFLIDRAAGEDFLADGYATGSWSVFEIGRLGFVFPALVGGRVWLGEMSSFAKVTLGAAWLAAVLYPNVVKVDGDELAESFYATLFGRAPELEAMADECKSLIDNRLPISKSDLNAEVSAFREMRSGEAQDMQKRLQEANDPSNWTDEELRESYEAMCEGWGVEPTEESWQQFLKEIREG